jgi:hypothetical protein
MRVRQREDFGVQEADKNHSSGRPKSANSIVRLLQGVHVVVRAASRMRSFQPDFSRFNETTDQDISHRRRRMRCPRSDRSRGDAPVRRPVRAPDAGDADGRTVRTTDARRSDLETGATMSCTARRLVARHVASTSVMVLNCWIETDETRHCTERGCPGCIPSGWLDRHGQRMMDQLRRRCPTRCWKCASRLRWSKQRPP